MPDTTNTDAAGDEEPLDIRLLRLAITAPFGVIRTELASAAALLGGRGNDVACDPEPIRAILDELMARRAQDRATAPAWLLSHIESALDAAEVHPSAGGKISGGAQGGEDALSPVPLPAESPSVEP